MSTYIKSVKATGIYNRFNLEQEFHDGINVLYGKNGTGKTTLLHILTNAVNLDVERFLHLIFKEVEVVLSDKTSIKLLFQKEARKREAGIELIINGKTQIFLPRISKFEEREKFPLNIYDEIYDRRELRRNLSYSLGATYFPAFRTMIEAWSSVEKPSSKQYAKELGRYKYYEDELGGTRRGYREDNTTTSFARRLFGDFIPYLNYPSPIEIEYRLNRQIRNAIYTVARKDQNIMSDAFVQAFSAISGDQSEQPSSQTAQEILETIEELTKELQTTPINIEERDETVYAKLSQHLKSFHLKSEEAGLAARILSIYEKSLQERIKIQNQSFDSIEAYIEAVNSFLENKKLFWGNKAQKGRQERIAVEFSDDKVGGLRLLSSGERQIVGLIFSGTRIRPNSIVLIDEPEISLHLDWQRMIIPAMENQLGGKQLIVCTHSPVIASAYDEDMKEVMPIPFEDDTQPPIFEDELESELFEDNDEIPF